MVRGDNTVNTLLTTEPVPHMGFSASPTVDNKTKQAIRKALLYATKSKQGREMLSAINFPGFEAANNQTYDGYAKLLDGVWGY